MRERDSHPTRSLTERLAHCVAPALLVALLAGACATPALASETDAMAQASAVEDDAMAEGPCEQDALALSEVVPAEPCDDELLPDVVVDDVDQAIGDDSREMAAAPDLAAAEGPSSDDRSQRDNAVDSEASEGTVGTEAPADAVTEEPLEQTEEVAIEAQATARHGHWVIDARSGALERYWVWDDGSLAKNVLIKPENGSGYYAWALADGRILRGKWDSGRGRVYVADNDGRLIGSDLKGGESGWVVTKKYDGGMQRYWVDAESRAAVSGFFTVDGYGDLFGLGGEGYVHRGDFVFGDRKWSADNDGRLRSGWYVTSNFGQGLQRYWMGDTVFGSPHAAAVSRLVDAAKERSGYYAWALADGRILRGKWDSGRGRVYVADNDGRLIGSDLKGGESGWVVTKAYDGNMQRYWVDAETRAAVSGFFTVDGYGDLFGLGGEGYVLRGTAKFGSSVIIADNDGKLPNRNGWVVSGRYGQGTQRYWVEYIYKNYRGTIPGYSVNGWRHYTLPEGYVQRNSIVNLGGGVAVVADNDGRLAKATPAGFLKVKSVTFTPKEAISLHEGIDFYKEDGKLLLERDFLKDGDRLVIATNRGTMAYLVVREFGDVTLVNEGDPYDKLQPWAFGRDDGDGVDFVVKPDASTITVRYLDKSTVVPVTIEADPIRSIAYSRPSGATLVKGVDSYETSDYYNGRWVTWQKYMTWMTLGDELQIVYSDGTRKTYVYQQAMRDGYPAELFVNAADETDTLDLDLWFESDQSYAHQWGYGKHEFTYELYGRTLTFGVTVVRAK